MAKKPQKQHKYNIDIMVLQHNFSTLQQRNLE